MVGATEARTATANQQLAYLARFLTDADLMVRLEAVRGLGQLGAVAVPLLEESLSGPDAQVAREAAAMLGKIGSAAARAVPALTAALKETNLKMRLAAVTALGNIGPAAAPAIPGLTAAMKGTHLVLARLAAQALSRIGRPAVDALVELLLNGDHHVRREAAWALGELGPAALAGPVLSRFAVPEVSKEAETLPETRNAKTPVIPLHKSDVIAEWREGPVSLTKSKEPLPDAITALNTALGDKDPKVRAAALQALESIQRGT